MSRARSDVTGGAMTEFAPAGRRGPYGAWQSFTVALGLLGGAGVAALPATVLSEQALNDWGRTGAGGCRSC